MTVFMDFEGLADSLRAGIVTLLYKLKDKTELKNWRPITRLNVACQLLATGTSTLSEEVVQPDPACKKIRDSLVLMRDTFC